MIPTNERSKEEVREIGRKGGIKSGEVRKQKKLLKDLLEEALSQEGESGNKYIDITVSLIKEAANGNVKAFEVIRDTLGQKPTDKSEVEANIDMTIKVDLLDD